MRLPSRLEALAGTARPVVAVVGDLNEDIAVLLNGPVVDGGQVQARISRHRGGSAANVCAGLAAAGVKNRFYGRVGDDDVGRILAARLSAEGVDVRVRHCGSSSSLLCLVQPGGERSFVADAAHPPQRHSEDVPARELGEVDLLHVSGYWLLSGIDLDWLGTRRLTSSDRRCLTVDLASVSRVRSYGPGKVRNLLSALRPDIVFANHLEAGTIGLLESPPTDGLLVVTCGAVPTRVVCNGEAVEIPVPPVQKVVDTTGAGDAFVAGFLAAAVGGAEIAAAVAVGHESARRVIQVVGPG